MATIQIDLAQPPHHPAGAAGAFSHESQVRSYCRAFDVRFTHSAESTLVDTSGKTYTDFLAGCGALNYGHNDPDMADGLMRYIASNGVVHGLDLHTEAKAAFIEAFVGHVLAPRGLSYKLQFTGPTGANAIEAALKLARKVTGRSNVIAFTNGFHGVTLGALAATGNSHHRVAPHLPLHGVTRALYDGYLGDDLDTAVILESLLDDPSSGVDAPAAILVETVQGEGGLNAASSAWLKHIARVAKAHGALLIVDDIQAGCGRTGDFFSFEPCGVVPDIVTLSKSISGFGLPMALVLIRPELDQWLPGEHNGTFRGNNLAFVTATVALNKFWADDELTVAVARKARIVHAALETMATELPGARCKGRGMLQGLDTRSGELAAAICQRCFRAGLIIETSGPHDEVVKILAPLTISDDQLECGLGVLRDAVIAEARHLTQQGSGSATADAATPTVSLSTDNTAGEWGSIAVGCRRS